MYGLVSIIPKFQDVTGINTGLGLRRLGGRMESSLNYIIYLLCDPASATFFSLNFSAYPTVAKINLDSKYMNMKHASKYSMEETNSYWYIIIDMTKHLK